MRLKKPTSPARTSGTHRNARVGRSRRNPQTRTSKTKIPTWTMTWTMRMTKPRLEAESERTRPPPVRRPLSSDDARPSGRVAGCVGIAFASHLLVVLREGLGEDVRQRAGLH